MTTPDRVAAAADFGQPSALKRGRNPKWPYVPVILHGSRQEQVRALAFVSRDEAVAAATTTIEARRQDLRQKLADPRYRALRQQHGLPRELSA